MRDQPMKVRPLHGPAGERSRDRERSAPTGSPANPCRSSARTSGVSRIRDRERCCRAILPTVPTLYSAFERRRTGPLSPTIAGRRVDVLEPTRTRPRSARISAVSPSPFAPAAKSSARPRAAHPASTTRAARCCVSFAWYSAVSAVRLRCGLPRSRRRLPGRRSRSTADESRRAESPVSEPSSCLRTPRVEIHDAHVSHPRPRMSITD